MTLSVTVLGCSGTWSSADSATSGYLVTDGTTRLWVDCGPGTLSALQRHCALTDLDGIVVTHSHPDHVLELPVVRNALKYGLGHERVPLITTRDVLRLMETLLGRQGIAPTFAPRMVGDRSRVEVGTLALTFSRTDHPVETVAVRIGTVDDGPSIAYSADTGPGWHLRTLVEDVDLALLEGTFLSAEVGEAESVHLTAEQAGTMAREAGAKRLVLTHITPLGDREAHRAEAAAAYGAPVELAEPHATFEVG